MLFRSGRGGEEAAMITSTQQGWLPAGYWPLWSSRRKLPRPLWYVTSGRVPSATGKDGDGQTSSDRRPKLWRKRGRVGGPVETLFGMDGRGLRSDTSPTYL